MIDPAWQGKVQFYELVFGTWLAYAFLVWMWESVINAPLSESTYILITWFGSSFFLINHYFEKAGFWIWVINGHTVLFVIFYYALAVRPIRGRSRIWKICVTMSFLPYTLAYIFFETKIARSFVQMGYSDFWVMLVSYVGFLWLILRRSRSNNAVVPLKEHES